MSGSFDKKLSIDSVINEKIPISNFVKGVLVFKNYYIAQFKSLSNPSISDMSNNDIFFSIMTDILKQEECTVMHCGEVTHPDFGIMRFPILFFDTFIFIGISFENNIIYCLLNPIVEETGLSSMDGISASMIITSLIISRIRILQEHYTLLRSGMLMEI